MSSSFKSGIFKEGSLSGSQAKEEPTVNNLSCTSFKTVLISALDTKSLNKPMKEFSSSTVPYDSIRI